MATSASASIASPHAASHVTTPATGDSTGNSVFITSTISSVAPSTTCWPTPTECAHTLPPTGDRTGCLAMPMFITRARSEHGGAHEHAQLLGRSLPDVLDLDAQPPPVDHDEVLPR